MTDKSRFSWVAALLSLLVVAGLVLAVGGCGPAPAPESQAKPAAALAKEIAGDGIFRLGVLGPFSGPSEITGREFQGAVTMALDAIDWQIGDYQIEPVWIDSQSDPDKAAQAYEEAVVEQGIQAAILNWHSSVAVACMEVAAQYKIPHIFAYGATEAVNEKFHSDPEKYGYWMNKGWPMPEKLTIAYVQAVEDAMARGLWAPKEKTVALCGENTHWGRSFVRAIKEQLVAEGWTPVAEEYFNLDEVGFYPLLNEFKSKDVALVAVTSTSMPSFAAFINQANEVGLESLLIADGLGWFGEWYGMTVESSNYVIDQIPGWATAEGQEFAAAFEGRWGMMPSSSAAGLAYDGTNMFIQIAEQALAEYGELSSQTIYTWTRENLQTGRWSYTDGIVMEEYKYTPETVPDPVVGQGYYTFPVLQYFDGEGAVIYPPEWAEEELEAKP
jgi:branched-chain amino acid transport system substrate-binding protein